MLPYDVGLPIAVRDDESDVPVGWHVVERPEPQGGLFNPAVVVVGRYRLTGRHTDKRYRRHFGEDADGQTRKVLVHDLTLQLFGGNVAQGYYSRN